MGQFYDKERGGWRYDFQAAGRRYLGGRYRTKREAADAEASRRLNLAAGHTEVFSTFGELVESYLKSSVRTKSKAWTYQIKLKLNRGFGHLDRLPLRELKRGHIERTLDDLKGRGNGPASVNEYRKIAVALLNYAVTMEAIERNPAAGIARVPESEHRVEPIETAHLKSLILGADRPMRSLLMFLSQTGARWIEGARLQWPEVMLDRPDPICILTTRKQRGGSEKKRPQPLSRHAVDALLAMRGQDPHFVFPSPRGGMASYNTNVKQLHLLCDRLSIPRYSFHQIRHWVGLVAIGSGASKKAVASFLGHTDTGVTERYLHVLESEMWQLTRELDQRAPELGGTLGGTFSESETK